MNRFPQISLSLFVPLYMAGTALAQQAVPTGEFTKIQLTNQFWAEGASYGDFNHDGKMDVVYGPSWWEGPDFTKRHAYADDSKVSKIKNADGTESTFPGFKGALSNENDYSRNFLAYTYDINGDGWSDILILGFPGETSDWFENPQGKDGPWVKHVALDVTDGESPAFLDVNGDGKPEIVCMSRGFIGYAEFDPKKAAEKWTWHNISTKGGWQRFTHGFGVGDINGDGRMDMIEQNGWWEQPASLAGDPVWAKHEALFGNGGAQMFAYDVNGDGKNDVITSIEAHGYGLAWFEQTNDGGAVGWTKHLIVGDKPEQNPQGIKFSQMHGIDLVDMDGDGLKDIVTGKRFWAHGPTGDKEPEAAPVLYWFQLQRAGGQASFVGHLIDDASGVGTQVQAGDLNGDKKPDVVVGNKRGAFVFLRK
ncbi:MAG: repeat protein [Chthoniobacteraceae bacterium]|nr:repeat protein [Chthoniobacteraceae bacterium]MDB6171142.1 repeat protein [Chthoniobacteraceae bacterium]